MGPPQQGVGVAPTAGRGWGFHSRNGAEQPQQEGVGPPQQEGGRASTTGRGGALTAGMGWGLHSRKGRGLHNGGRGLAAGKEFVGLKAGRGSEWREESETERVRDKEKEEDKEGGRVSH